VSALTCARVGIGVSATIKAVELWPRLHRLAADPEIVPMPLAWWPHPSGPGMTFVVIAWGILGAALAAGIGVRVSGAALAIVLGYIVTLDQQSYSSHLYLLALTAGLMAAAHSERGREPAIALLRWQLVLVYAFAALSKLNPAFVSGLLISLNLRPVFWGFRWIPLLMSLALATIAAEAFLAWSLVRPRWRMTGAVVGVGLHVGFIVMVTETVAMIVFAIVCLSMYPLFWMKSAPGAVARGVPA
jgi:hypothetical protein